MLTILLGGVSEKTSTPSLTLLQLIDLIKAGVWAQSTNTCWHIDSGTDVPNAIGLFNRAGGYFAFNWRR